MPGRLDGKTAIITGAASGQGRVAAQLFAAEGALLALADKDAEGLAETAAAIAEAGAPAPLAVVADLTSEEENARLAQAALDACGRIDALYNAAGLVRFGSLHETSLEDWRFVIDHELTMVFLACKHVLPAMMAARAGSIVNVSSVSGYAAGSRRHPAHAAAKAAIAGLTKQIAVEYGPLGIRCNAIAPGFLVYGEGQRRIAGQSGSGPPVEAVPLQRHVAPEDTARCALYLASDESAMTNGQTIIIDGGRSIA